MGGHYYPYSTEDPWAAVTYSSTAGGTAVVRTVFHGLGLADALGHAVVVHAADGTVRVGCGVLQPYFFTLLSKLGGVAEEGERRAVHLQP